jgi:hypothetical protein
VNLPPDVHPFLPTQLWSDSYLTAVIRSAGVIQANAMESTERVVIWNAAAKVMLAYVLGLRESSVMSLSTRAQNITHTATNEGVSEGMYHAVAATHVHARIGVALLPSRSHGSIPRVRLVFRPDLQRSAHGLTRARCPPANFSHGTYDLGLLDELCNI